MKPPTAHRDKAIVLLLIDTGLRLSEVCRLRIKDVGIELGQVYVKLYGSGQKAKSRIVYIGKSTRRAIWRHLAGREIVQPENPSSNLLQIQFALCSRD